MVVGLLYRCFDPRPDRAYLPPRELSLGLARLQLVALLGMAAGVLAGSAVLMFGAAGVLAVGVGVWLWTEKNETRALEFRAAERGARGDLFARALAVVAHLAAATGAAATGALSLFSAALAPRPGPRLQTVTLSPRLLPIPRIPRA